MAPFGLQPVSNKKQFPTMNDAQLLKARHTTDQSRTKKFEDTSTPAPQSKPPQDLKNTAIKSSNRDYVIRDGSRNLGLFNVVRHYYRSGSDSHRVVVCPRYHTIVSGPCRNLYRNSNANCVPAREDAVANLRMNPHAQDVGSLWWASSRQRAKMGMQLHRP